MAQQNPSSQQIIDALKPKPPLTRSLSVAPAEQAKKAETDKFVDTLRNRPTRSLSTDERQQIATVAETRPRIDLEIKFDYNSANIAQSRALPDMNNLGKALSDPALKGSTFVLAGHTDAVGGEEYNQDLSNRRADAVKRYLTDKFGLASEQSRDRRLRQDRLKNNGQAHRAREPPRRGRQHGGQVSARHCVLGASWKPGRPLLLLSRQMARASHERRCCRDWA